MLVSDRWEEIPGVLCAAFGGVGFWVGSRVISRAGSWIGSRAGSWVGSRASSWVSSQIGSWAGCRVGSWVGSRVGLTEIHGLGVSVAVMDKHGDFGFFTSARFPP